LDQAAKRPYQPFDPPKNAALAVYLHADRRAILERNRLMIQVGLKAAERFSGTRQGMNVGIVLDLRTTLSPDQIQAVRALLFAFERSKDFGDRFRLIVAGKSGGTILTPEEFKYGYLTVIFKRLFEEKTDSKKGKGIGLVEALKFPI
jgi:hypothetical protein